MSRLRMLVLALAIVVEVGVCAAPSPAAQETWNARVLWARADRAYIVLAESMAVTPGTMLTFQDGAATIAEGEVSASYEGQLVSVTLTSGSLGDATSLSSVRITAEPPSLRPMSLLRVGYPAPGRSQLLLACERVTPRPAREGDHYRVDALSDRSFRFVREPGVASEAPWPDTLLVRLFDVAADEEIALERGDLDVAVFWPGEPSPHIRAQTSWTGDPAGSLAGSMLVAQHGPEIDRSAFSSPGPIGRALRAMNEDLFRGDLSPCGPAATLTPPDTSIQSSTTRARFEVNHVIPGWQTLERLLNQGLPAKAGSIPKVTLTRVHVGATGADPPQGVCVFTIRCPILSAPRLRPYLGALGPDALTRLFTCFPVSGGP
jgi:hypothetical protein